MTDRIQSAAEAIFEARKKLAPIPPIRDSFDVRSAAEAYSVQETNTKRYLQAGRRLSGRKIGLTAKAVQAQLGVDEPDYGMLWQDYGFEGGEIVPLGKFMQPRIEAEIAFVLSTDLDVEEPTLLDVMGAVDYAVPAIEIVDSAIAEWNIRLVDTIADNASAGGYVVGSSPKCLSQVDLRLCGMLLTQNGQPASLGVGAACLDHPLNAVRWLAKKMIAVGRPLKAGDLILSGALGPMVPVHEPAFFTIEIQGFAPLNVSFR